jgi:hypothetical protein
MGMKVGIAGCMKNTKHANIILWIEAAGFGLVITVSWLDAMIGLPRRIFGAPSASWHEPLLETIVGLLTWLLVLLANRRMLNRLHYLEEFTRICAWCRKIDCNDQWVPLEEYFDRKFSAQTSHGICPNCAREVAAKGTTGETKS